MHPKILKFLEIIGIYKPIVTPKPPSPLEVLQQKLQVSGENQELLRAEQMKSDAALDELLKHRDQIFSTTTNFHDHPQEKLFLQILEQIQVLEYIDSKTPEPPSKENLDKIKKELVKSLKLISRPAKEALTQINDYLETFEEGILLEEARGIYKFKISENDRWVKLPLLSTFEKPSAARIQAEKEIKKLFQTIPELDLLDFANTIPFRPISFIEIEKLAKDKKIATVKTNKSGEVYWYIF